MNDEKLHEGIRRILRTFGVGAQKEIEAAVRKALAEGSLAPDQPVRVRARLELLDSEFVVEDELSLQ